MKYVYDLFTSLQKDELNKNIGLYFTIGCTLVITKIV